MSLPFKDSFFDVVLSDGVWHHTPSMLLALQSIVQKGELGGTLYSTFIRKKPQSENLRIIFVSRLHTCLLKMLESNRTINCSCKGVMW